jgi:hypothetical protein
VAATAEKTLPPLITRLEERVEELWEQRRHGPEPADWEEAVAGEQ